jgi:hypothetical protein
MQWSYYELDACKHLSFCAYLTFYGKVEDYQSSKKKEFKNFKENLESFWDNLVRECQHGPLFDQVLFDKCMDYIIALSWLVWLPQDSDFGNILTHTHTHDDYDDLCAAVPM